MGIRDRLRFLPSLLCLPVAALLLIAPPAFDGDLPEASGVPLVHVLYWEGAIGPITAEYLGDELVHAADSRCDLVVLVLDTPGGLDNSMRVMIQDILASPVPVAVYVAPGGARAASAGAFLMAASHVAAMAPATNIGAAHPVNMGGKLDETMSAKVTNDAAAYIGGLAESRGRNVEWYRAAVRQSVSAPADSALAVGVIDCLAEDLDALLEACDGRLVAISGEDDPVAVRSAGAIQIERRPSWRQDFLRRITDPNVAYIFLMLGIYGLFFELSRPGAILPGVVGAISLLLAMLAFQSLPVNYVGVLLILVGMVLLLLEIKIVSYGSLALGGVVALLLGSLLLFDRAVPAVALSLKVVLPVVLVSAAFFLLLVGLGLKAQARRKVTGVDALIGEIGEIVRLPADADEAYEATVAVFGELWQCRSEELLRRGQRVVVTACDGRMVTVAQQSGSGEHSGG